MHYWDVPRLGSFMAVPMIYNACLFEEAVDAAIDDYQAKGKARDEQAKAKAEFDEAEAARKEECAKTGERFVPEEKEWDNLEPAEFEI